jgi:drug/metabolite transporter (DMT)-like permease
MISGFGLEAAALTVGRIAIVEPVMIAELPLTIVGARLFLGRRLTPWTWVAMIGLAAAVAVFVGALAPDGGHPGDVPLVAWLVAGGLSVGVAVVCTVLAVLWPGARAALLGVATGTAFALMSALVSAVGALYGRGGVDLLLTSWQTYAALVVGPASFFLLQNALQAGSLVASQPGFTLVNPLASVLWGVLVFEETVRSGIWLAVAGVAAAGVVVATVALVWLVEHGGQSEQPQGPADGADTDRTAAGRR